MTTPPLVPSFGGQPPPHQQQQQAQAARDVNTSSLCRIGQETVQDIVLRTMEIFQLLRNMQLPNGVTYHPNTHQDRLGKLQEHLRMLSVLFRKLRLVYDKCNENCAGLFPVPPEQLIPFVEDDGSKHEDRSGGHGHLGSEERREILEVNKVSCFFTFRSTTPLASLTGFSLCADKNRRR
ncbi:mediator of RNA polymerase II transcription subunit 30 [Austrofundulus limnaeus]|uniref:Mediator of RNA polymerase II transcription subunit 30 n=1 Tax=Austrofundulus limnaeus TaxID=52670 RepID=A0A2I4CD57_AUSLI|nr:PREDICTED: mediator of RNA polymerase II transcription subunit 30 [Austrofundulus limnaeus]